jgi:hypothetical protein
MVEPKIRLYVKSVKRARALTAYTGDHLVEQSDGLGPRRAYGWGGSYETRTPNVKTGPKEKYVLPEDQGETVEMVKSIASKHGLEVEVIDVARESVFRREIQREREKLRIFPTLIVSSGGRIEGDLTESQVESLLCLEQLKNTKN